MLLGCHETSIDEKSRMLIPVEIRKAISPQPAEYASYVMVGPNGKIWTYPVATYLELIQDLEYDPLPSSEKLDFIHTFFSNTEKVPWDEQNRILLPRHMTERTGTSGKVYMIGARDHGEIWTRDSWRERLKDLDSRRDEIMAEARKAQQKARETRTISA